LTELIESYTQIEETLYSLFERREVLVKTSSLINSKSLQLNPNSNSVSASMASDFKINSGYYPDQRDVEAGTLGSGLDIFSGVAKAEDEMRLKRMIFRVSKGRAVSTFWDLDIDKFFEISKEDKTNKKDKKKIFSVFFQGGEENVLKIKILKIFDLFSATRYNVPAPKEIREVIENINNDINEKISFLMEAEKSILDFLTLKYGEESTYFKFNGKGSGDDEINIQKNSNGEDSYSFRLSHQQYVQYPYALYKVYFRKEKVIYSNLNKCILRDTFIDGEVWIPEIKLNQVLYALKNVFRDNENRLTANLFDAAHIDEDIKPPTFIPSNDFLWSFQEIVNTYGVPRYGEVNPAYFNIVSFPFLFGVMFGDIGHGFILFLFGIYLCLWNSSIEKDKTNLFRSMLKGRYLFLLMGFFAFYCGWIYNDFFSVPLQAFPTCYKSVTKIGEVQVALKEKDCVYPFGFDYKWYVSSNELGFFNSFKMKMSVILGVMHMLFGVLLKGVNAVYFRDWIDFLCGFIPQFIFMTILFGYMDILIYIKWATNWDNKGRGNAPSLINLMMNIFLKEGSVEGKPVFDGTYEGRFIQEWVHIGILILAFILIPIMLFIKPYYEYKKTKVHHRRSSGNSEIKEQLLVDHLKSEVQGNIDHHTHSFSEIFIHQVIETIEFVLGAVSNTASYLRLWALSLAHGQLSKVFFQKSIQNGIDNDNIFYGIIILFLGYIVFASITFFVLMCMDLMECFLHTLRLHW
jgi:V-type H+-transporting ATPase subunit a